MLIQETETEYEPNTYNTKIKLKEIELHDRIYLERTKVLEICMYLKTVYFHKYVIIQSNTLNHILIYL